MARIAIDAALGSGFTLIRRQPGAVLLWGLVYLALGAAHVGLLGPFYMTLFSQIAADARLGAEASPQAMNALMPQMMAMQGWNWLLSLAGLFVGAILYCATFRAILHPEQKRFGYLRVGATELLLFVLGIAAYIVFAVALVVVALVVALLIAALIAMHAVAVGVIVGVLAAVAALIVIVWLSLRFSMVGPMMVSDGKFHLFESWSLTRGHAATLFIMAICLLAILVVAEMVIVGILIAAAILVTAVAGGGWAHLSSFFDQSPIAIVAGIAPALILIAVILTPLMGCYFAISGAPWARAYLDLTEPGPAAVAG
ncbi:MAG: hypothetical protein ACR2F8_13855 [Caulobacteraceae bacterium]